MQLYLLINCNRTDSQEIDNDVDEWEGLTLQGVFLDYSRVFSAVMDCLTKVRGVSIVTHLKWVWLLYRNVNGKY